MVTVAVERQHGVDEVLERPGTREPAVLGDVSDEQRRDAERLRVPHEPARALAHLARRAGLGAAGRVGHRLDRVDDEDRGLELAGGADDGIEVGRRQHVAARRPLPRAARLGAAPVRRTPRPR